MIRLLGLLILLMPSLASAQTFFPALFDVTGVASDDHLNIRAKPAGGAPVLGELARNARNVEVIRTNDDDTWGLVNSGEGAGWVSMRYLKRVSDMAWPDYANPVACSGTEPFWDASIDLANGFADHRFFDDPPRRYTIAWQARPAGTLGDTVGLRAIGAPGDEMFATIRPATCHDGMSDREYGLQTDLFVTENNEIIGYTGCCLLATP